MPKPPVIGSPRFFRILWMILREAKLGGRLLCALGMHRWATRTEVEKGFGQAMVTDHQWCTRAFCKYNDPDCVVNRELREWPHRVV